MHFICSSLMTQLELAWLLVFISLYYAFIMDRVKLTWMLFITLKEFNSILHWLSIHSFYLRMKNVLGLLLNLIIVK